MPPDRRARPAIPPPASPAYASSSDRACSASARPCLRRAQPRATPPAARPGCARSCCLPHHTLTGRPSRRPLARRRAAYAAAAPPPRAFSTVSVDNCQHFPARPAPLLASSACPQNRRPIHSACSTCGADAFGGLPLRGTGLLRAPLRSGRCAAPAVPSHPCPLRAPLAGGARPPARRRSRCRRPGVEPPTPLDAPALATRPARQAGDPPARLARLRLEHRPRPLPRALRRAFALLSLERPHRQPGPATPGRPASRRAICPAGPPAGRWPGAGRPAPSPRARCCAGLAHHHQAPAHAPRRTPAQGCCGYACDIVSISKQYQNDGISILEQ